MLLPTGATAQTESEAGDVEEIVVTGTRIRAPGLVSSSPVLSIGADEIFKQQEPEVEKILRLLPITIPGDNQNVNNGTDGIATVDLRGLGAERSIVLMNGQRMTPSTAVVSASGHVDISTVPTALIERVDILTGGASTVYGSDAVAGAVNFIMKRNFTGVDLRYSHRLEGTESKGEDGNTGAVDSFSLTLGGDIEEGRGNVVFNFSYTDRKPLLLGALPFGNLGINTAPDRGMGGVEVSGEVDAMGDPILLPDIDPDMMGTQTDPNLWVNAGLASYLGGASNIPPTDPGCVGPGASDHTTGSGSTTAIPTRVEIAAAGGTFGQFRNDRSIGSECARFNFNPFNYFQTPQEKYSLFSMGRFEVNDWIEAYSQLSFTHTTVVQQVAPSGTFGATFWVPLSNPLIGASARQAIIDQGNAQIASLDTDPTSPTHNWRDENGDGVVDEGDYLNMLLRRRTLELGLRSERYESDYFQMLIGARGDFAEYFNYDISFSYGQSNRTTIRGGYTNLTNIQNALDVPGFDSAGNAISAEDATCLVSDSSCVPLDLFGGFGTITPAMAAYATAIALQQQKYEQRILTATVGGAHPLLQLPTAQSPLAFSAGFEIRNEEGRLEPDECLKLAPASCQGGAGGNLLPYSSSYKATDYFVEAILPVLDDVFLAKSLQVEAGFRTTDYDVVGSHNTWKFGFNWRPVDELLVRVMSQQAIRGPNIGELAAPPTTGLDNAQLDPCSSANLENLREGGVATGALLTNDLVQRCMDTGQTAANVGTTDDVISNQLNDFRGTDLNNLPTPSRRTPSHWGWCGRPRTTSSVSCRTRASRWTTTT